MRGQFKANVPHNKYYSYYNWPFPLLRGEKEQVQEQQQQQHGHDDDDDDGDEDEDDQSIR